MIVSQLNSLNLLNQLVSMTTYTLDASKEPLGRLAAKAAVLLMGKNRADFKRHAASRVKIIITNSDSLMLTGRKWLGKKYYRHSGYLGHLKEITAERMKKADSRRMVRIAIIGMLPKNKLASQLIKNLEVRKSDIQAK